MEWFRLSALDKRISELSIRGKTIVEMMDKTRESTDAFWRLNEECERCRTRILFLKNILRESREECANPIRFLHREMVKLSADLESASDETGGERWISEREEIEIKLEECHSMIDRLAG